jgi:hypothetical protein
MAGVARIPRSRGGVSGVLLILLGAWGGLAPFVGPYVHFAYTPDKAWAYTSGRLWLSAVPGAAAVLGGLLTAGAAHRAVGCFGAFIAAAGGAWFIVGGAVTGLVARSSISPGAPLTGPLGGMSSATRVFLEGLGFFTGTGVLILFFGALALGRFSVVGVKDAALAQEMLPGVPGEAYPAGLGQPPAGTGYPATTGQFPAQGSSQYPPEQTGPPTEQYPPEQARPSTEQYPTTTGPFGTPPPDTRP